jgi:tetratricopeptide (TPR) repeat protein
MNTAFRTCRSAPTHAAALSFFVALCGLLVSPTANALTFTPSESEWMAWPEYCRARYVVSGAGIDSEFERRMSMAEVKSWQARLGPAWDGLHHYCAGLALHSRAKVERDPAQKKFLLQRVVSENRFTLDATPESHPMWAEIAARSGLIYGELNEESAALEHFDLAVKACPTCVMGYQGKAMYFRGRKKLPQAREALEAGIEALDGRSAELHYVLGLVLVELGDYPGATQHARTAYDMGYPLPGLRDRLARAGHPLSQ